MSGVKKSMAMVMLALPFAVLLMLAQAIYLQREETITDAVENYDRLRSVASVKLDEFEAETDSRGLFLSSGPASVVTAELQAKLREVAGQNQVEIIQASELKLPEATDGLTRLGIRLEMLGSSGGIQTMLKSINANVPRLYVDKVEFRSNEAAGQQVEPPLWLGIDVWGITEGVSEIKVK
jgi:hypothetical protein